MPTNTTRVAVLMGSNSDGNIIQHCLTQLRELGITFQSRILSAHRTPNETIAFIQQAEQSGVQVFIAAAGMAAHLAGAVAAHTTAPVIGVPLPGGMQDGLDALLSTVQMPAGMPVACMSVGKAGAINAALLAAQILACNDHVLAEKIKEIRLSTQQKLALQDKHWQAQQK